jgi:hypothetical protein
LKQSSNFRMSLHQKEPLSVSTSIIYLY